MVTDALALPVRSDCRKYVAIHGMGLQREIQCGNRYDKKVYRWRSTRWWHSLKTEMMERDPENHTRWTHKWTWHNRGNVWDNIATDWGQVKKNG